MPRPRPRLRLRLRRATNGPDGGRCRLEGGHEPCPDAVVEGADIGGGVEPFAGPGRRRAFDVEVSAGVRQVVWNSGGVQELPEFPGGMARSAVTWGAERRSAAKPAVSSAPGRGGAAPQ